MKKVEFAAVEAFKTKVENLSAFFAAKGYAIQHMHLMEGLSQYEGARDWRTYRAQLSGARKESKSSLRVSPQDVADGKFDMGDKEVTVYLMPYVGVEGDLPEFMSLTVDQEFVDRLRWLQAESQRYMESVVEDSLLVPEWIDNGLPWTMVQSAGKVFCDVVTFYGYDEKTGTYIGTGELRIEGLLEKVGEAVLVGESEVINILDEPDIEELKRQLGRQVSATAAAPEKVKATGKSVTVYFDAHSCQYGKYSPDFCSVDVDETWIAKVLALRGHYARSTRDVHEGTFAPDWIDNDQPWNIYDDGMTLSGKSFWFYATQEGGRIESPVYVIDDVVKKVQEALTNNTPEIFLLESPSAVGKLMAQLERKPGDPLYVGTPLTEQERYALASCLTYWGGLSYAEVLAILDGNSPQPRDSIDAKDELANDDDEVIAQEIRQAYDDYPSYMTP